MTELTFPQNLFTREKLVFWLFLAGLSAVSAEVVSNATLFPFFTFWGLVVVVPTYGLHTLVLASLSFRERRVTLTTLFLTGAIFGMYEAYLTKVLWNPTWGEWTLQFGGIYVVQTIVLVLFWHPLMAYIVPVFFAENLLTGSSETFEALPKRLRDAFRTKSGWTKFVILFAVYASLCKSFSAGNALLTFLSSASNIGILIGLGWWWNKICAGRNLTFRDVLPSKKEFNVLASLLLAMYVVMGIFVRSEALPRTIVPHLTVWIIYAALFVLLYFNMKRAAEITEPTPAPFHRQALRTGVILLIALSILPVLLLPVKIITIVLVLLSWVVGCTVGAILLVRSLRAVFPVKGDSQ